MVGWNANAGDVVMLDSSLDFNTPEPAPTALVAAGLLVLSLLRARNRHK